MKHEENLKYWKKKKKSIFKKIQTTFHQYQKLYSTPPGHGAHTCKVSRKYIHVFLSCSAKTKHDGRGVLQYLPSWAFGTAGTKIKDLVVGATWPGFNPPSPLDAFRHDAPVLPPPPPPESAVPIITKLVIKSSASLLVLWVLFSCNLFNVV